MHCDQTVHFGAELSLRLDVHCSGHPETKTCPPTPSRPFASSTWQRSGVWMSKLGVISQERLKIEVKLQFSANRKSYMPHQLAQQQMTLSDLEWPFHASRAISAVAELLIISAKEIMQSPVSATTSV